MTQNTLIAWGNAGQLSTAALKGNFVELLPLERSHRDPLVDAANDGELWKLWYTGVPSADSIDEYIETALAQREASQALPFIVVNLADNKIIGSTRFCNASHQDRRLEIGYTWYSQSYQRTAVNTETKLLLLSFAFERLNCIGVEFRTHWHNFASRRAIERLGAKQDGVLRSHKIINGLTRDTVVFSILENEWPTIKQSLQFRMSN